MKNILKYIKTSILMSILLVIGGCEDFSDPQSYGSPTSDQFWKTESDLQNAVNAMYTYTTQEEVSGRGHFWFENCSDNMVTGRDNTTADNIKNFINTANVGYIWDMWMNIYLLIGKANSILLFAPDMNIDEKAKNFGIGQAYFFRGYGYLWLTPWFGDTRNGGIPIVKEDTPVDETNVPRPASVLENYELIIDDLRKAADLLPSWSELNPSDYGRPYKTAAWAFAARAALYAAQWDNKYYDVVIEMCDNIIGLEGTADRRGLLNNYADLFTPENNFSIEYIYSMLGNVISGPKYHGMGLQQDGWTINTKNYNTWGYFQPTAELYEAYTNEGDVVRRDATLLVPGQHIQWLGEDCHFGVNPEGISSTTQITCHKFASIFAPSNARGTTLGDYKDNPCNILGTIVMRYADVLLMKAEALIWTRSEGNTEAQQLINRVRKRVGLPEDSPATKAALKKERRLELAFEFLPSRHFDLVRWGDAQAAYGQPLHGYQRPESAADYPDFSKWNKVVAWSPRTFDPVKNQVFAIPQNAISSTDGVLIQNIGY